MGKCIAINSEITVAAIFVTLASRRKRCEFWFEMLLYVCLRTLIKFAYDMIRVKIMRNPFNRTIP